MPKDIDVRPIPVDKLAAFEEPALADRHRRLTAHVEEYTQQVTSLQADLEEARRILTFVEKEKENVELAQQLARGDIVRVVCPACSGTGMKPADITSGQVRHGTAFEGTKAQGAPVIDERSRCAECKGQRWVIMPRFKG